MKRITSTLLLLLCGGLLLSGRPVASQTNPQAAKIGLFDDHRDIGTVKMPGTVEYDDARA